MIFPFSSRGQEPLFWVGGRPVSTTFFCVSLYLVATIAMGLLMAAGRHDVIGLFNGNSSAVARGEVWRLVTYPLLNAPSIWLALQIGMLYYFGSLIESMIGSRKFAFFYGGLVLLQGILFQIPHFFGYASQTHGMGMINMALFAAFVSMCPSVSFFFGIAARWMLLLLLGLSSLQLMAEHQWIPLAQLLTLSMGAIFFMKKNGYQEPLYFFSSPDLKKLLTPSLPKPVAIPTPEMQTGDRHFTGSAVVTSVSEKNSKKPATPFSAVEKSNVEKNISMIHVDQLLDKIHATGINSLTEQEKEKLEEARLALLERDQRAE